MKFKRIIARLDIKNNALVKGIHLEGLRVLGNPQEYASKYSRLGIDEIIYMDVVASLYERNGLLELVKSTAKNIFVPLTVGGGIRSIEDVAELLNAGADKICINTAAINNPSLITEISNVYGASTVVVAIEAIKVDGRYLVFTDNGREYTGKEVVDWAIEVERLGAGEILLTSVDKEGTLNGFDLELIDMVKKVVDLPLIVHGGFGNINHALELFDKHDVDAFCSAGALHYSVVDELGKIDDKILGNQDFLKSKKFNKSGVNLKELKEQLNRCGIGVRL